MAYARGKHALGLCDRCGQRYKLSELKPETNTGVSRHNRVCPECWDVDHPQNFLHRLKPVDPETLRDPRPQDDLEDSRSEAGSIDDIKLDGP